MRKTPVKQYECRRCGESHPFNIYCPNIRDPPIIPGECRSCGTTTKEHANDCQYVAIKDNIGLCTYCRALNHWYADCPQRITDYERSMREKKKNKRNNRRRGKVKIVAGVMTREQDSDSTLPSERREVEIVSPHRIGDKGTWGAHVLVKYRSNRWCLHRKQFVLSVVLLPMGIEIVLCCISIYENKQMP